MRRSVVHAEQPFAHNVEYAVHEPFDTPNARNHVQVEANLRLNDDAVVSVSVTRWEWKDPSDARPNSTMRVVLTKRKQARPRRTGGVAFGRFADSILREGAYDPAWRFSAEKRHAEKTGYDGRRVSCGYTPEQLSEAVNAVLAKISAGAIPA